MNTLKLWSLASVLATTLVIGLAPAAAHAEQCSPPIAIRVGALQTVTITELLTGGTQANCTWTQSNTPVTSQVTVSATAAIFAAERVHIARAENPHPNNHVTLKAASCKTDRTLLIPTSCTATDITYEDITFPIPPSPTRECLRGKRGVFSDQAAGTTTCTFRDN